MQRRYGQSAAPIAHADCLSTSTASRFGIGPPGVAHPQACLPTFFDVTERPCSPLNLFTYSGMDAVAATQPGSDFIENPTHKFFLFIYFLTDVKLN